MIAEVIREVMAEVIGEVIEINIIFLLNLLN